MAWVPWSWFCSQVSIEWSRCKGEQWFLVEAE
jgi:hypothetical protein